jgi:biopolymer transport protein ExbD
VADDPVPPGTLAAALDARTGAQRDTPIFLRADRSVTYAALMQVLDGLRAAGYLKVALVGLEAAP